MLINHLIKREYTNFKDNSFDIILDLMCKKRLEEKDYNLYNYMIENSFYNLKILIDNKEYNKIDSHSHDIKIFFENKITEDNFIVRRLNLNNVSYLRYHFFDNEGIRQFVSKEIGSDSEFIDIKDIDIYDENIIKNIIRYKKSTLLDKIYFWLKITFVIFLIIYIALKYM